MTRTQRQASSLVKRLYRLVNISNPSTHNSYGMWMHWAMKGGDEEEMTNYMKSSREYKALHPDEK